MTAPRVLSQPLGGSPLAIAAQRGFANDWYPARPRGLDGWRAHLREVAEEHRHGAWLRALGPALAPTGNAAKRVHRVVDGRGAVVSTGQQAALFGGPLYTLNKALSALAIADTLERETGIPTVPVFWAATDDADFDEACWAALAVSGELLTVRLPSPDHTGVPMSRVPLRDVEPLFRALTAACGSVADPNWLEQAGMSFRNGETIGNAYLRLMRALLEPLGMPVLDASHPVVRENGSPVLHGALTRAVDLEIALRARHESIREAGYVPQVEHLSDLTLVFLEDPGGEKRRIPLLDAARHVDTAPPLLGPNVLLRPVLERFIMPSACYVAGPGELAYFAQVGAVAQTLGVPAPLPLPRWSATILEPRIERVLERLGVTPEELRDRAVVETRMARAKLPASVKEALRALRRDLEANLTTLERSDRDKLIPTASLEGLRHWAEHRFDRLERRYAAALKRRETQMMHDIGTATAALYPKGQPQERVLNFIPFLARYGAPLIDAMRDEAIKDARSLIGAGAPDGQPERV